MAANKSRAGMTSSRKGRGDKKDNSKDEDQNEIMVPQLAWKILDASMADKLIAMSPKEMSKELATILDCSEYEVDLKQASLVDIYVSTIWFARENEFTTEQCSAFFTIVHTLLANLKDKHMSIEDNFQELKLMMKNVGVSKQTLLQCFTVDIADKVLQYVSDSVFQHYSLYEFLFTEDQEEQDSMVEEVHICLPPPLNSLSPAPLEEAVSEEFYSTYISPPPAVTESDSCEVDTTDHQLNIEEAEQLSSILSKMDQDEVKAMMHKIAQDTVSSYKEQIDKALQTRESDYSTKLEKISKAHVK